ncbi:50S ribosomal protein L33 [Candidatus Peregrinibacteria bacterium]|nr:50S ribosomal protein L33 [Candidatus Peregrinibacteria bacterium]
MPRGKNTNVYLICQVPECKMQNYKTRINKKTTPKLEHSKFCPKCRKHTPHASGSEIKHSS